MRTYEEIAEDIYHAAGISNAEALRALATEMEALGTPKAQADSWRAFGLAARLTADYAGGLEYYRRALALYEELGDAKGVAGVKGNIGTAYNDMGDHRTALEYLQHALALHVELDNRTGMAAVSGNIGIVCSDTGDYPLALEHHQRALALYEELGDRIGVARVTGNIGNVYQYIGDYPSALEYDHRALALHQEVGNRFGMANATANIGTVRLNTGDYAAALEHYQRALALYEELGNRDYVAKVTGNIGGVYLNSGDYAAALEHLQRALAVHEELGNRADVLSETGRVTMALIGLDRFDEAAALLERQANVQIDDPRVRAHRVAHAATIAEHRDDLDATQRHLLDALAVCAEFGLRHEAADFHRRLRNLAQKRNDFAGYIEHNKEYQRITEEIRGKEATQRLAMMEAERKMEGERRERDKERALLYGALPESVATRILRGEKVTGDHFEHAAVLFIDVASFTTHTAVMQPGDVVLLLEDLFSRMDNICDRHGAVKIKTIGDSYMCFRGDGTEAENALSIARVATDVARTPFTWPDNSPLIVRMGAHIGAATAGVIGTQRLQYDVWGDTVNVASRMESHGEPGRVHVSEEFATALRTVDGGQWTVDDNNDSMTNDSMTLMERGEISIKGKGPMTTYWLEPTP